MSDKVKEIKVDDLPGEIEKVKLELVQIEQCYYSTRSLFVKDRTLFIVGRHEDRSKYIFFVSDFYPRFFVEVGENIDVLPKEEREKIKEIKTKEDGDEWNFRNLGGEKELMVIYTYRTSQVPEIRGFFTKTYEANIRFTEVFKRDKHIHGHFYVPAYALRMQSRNIKINGINYIMLYEKEVEGGELEF